jgi:hypothetical protein
MDVDLKLDRTRVVLIPVVLGVLFPHGKGYPRVKQPRLRLTVGPPPFAEVDTKHSPRGSHSSNGTNCRDPGRNELRQHAGILPPRSEG